MVEDADYSDIENLEQSLDEMDEKLNVVTFTLFRIFSFQSCLYQKLWDLEQIYKHSF